MVLGAAEAGDASAVVAPTDRAASAEAARTERRSLIFPLAMLGAVAPDWCDPRTARMVVPPSTANAGIMSRRVFAGCVTGGAPAMMPITAAMAECAVVAVGIVAWTTPPPALFASAGE
ncbi:hypothetical protein SHKM778_43230 [Streptomyces sp. KM77-8]|uniref:Uncharacterized protein n=1 Tax=Streptomyces haneummycinicus TaxID=3074435 RepID=A0AAT9HKJ0_9ACTN